MIVARRRSGVFAEQSAAGATRLRRASVEKAAEAAAAAARGAAAVAQSGGQEFAEITAESVLNAGKESIKTRAAWRRRRRSSRGVAGRWTVKSTESCVIATITINTTAASTVSWIWWIVERRLSRPGAARGGRGRRAPRCGRRRRGTSRGGRSSRDREVPNVVVRIRWWRSWRTRRTRIAFSCGFVINFAFYFPRADRKRLEEGEEKQD